MHATHPAHNSRSCWAPLGRPAEIVLSWPSSPCGVAASCQAEVYSLALYLSFTWSTRRRSASVAVKNNVSQKGHTCNCLWHLWQVGRCSGHTPHMPCCKQCGKQPLRLAAILEVLLGLGPVVHCQHHEVDMLEGLAVKTNPAASKQRRPAPLQRPLQLQEQKPLLSQQLQSQLRHLQSQYLWLLQPPIQMTSQCPIPWLLFYFGSIPNVRINSIGRNDVHMHMAVMCI